MADVSNESLTTSMNKAEVEAVCMGKADMRSEFKPAEPAIKPKPRLSGRGKGNSARMPRSDDSVGKKPMKSDRQSKLERARRLLEDARYPSDEVIESVAELLARNWQRDKNMRAGSGG